MNEERKACKERIKKEVSDTLKTVGILWKLYCAGDEADPDLGRFEEYGLGFDYVAPNTFQGQRRGYFRWQLSWGGPSDEFRFYVGAELDPYKVEYVFMDWFDGAKRKLHGKAEVLLLEIWEQYFKESGAAQAELDKAREE